MIGNGLGFQSMPPLCCEATTRDDGSMKSVRRPSYAGQNSKQKVIVLMRHGMTDWNFDGRVQGGLDKSRLNKIGVKQARQAGLHLRSIHVDSILCSPLTRARETLRYLSESSGNPFLSRKPEILPALMEFQVPWQGLLRRDILNGPWGKSYCQYMKNPLRFSFNGFNPIRDINRRAETVWETISRSTASSYLVVSHNQMNKALLCTAIDVPTVLGSWNQSNCCFNVFVLEDGKLPRLRLSNGTDVNASYFAGRRARQRVTCARIVLYRQGHTKGLRRELEAAKIAQIYMLGTSTSEPFEEAGVRDLDGVCTHIPLSWDHVEDLHQRCTEIVEEFLTLHMGKTIIVSFDDSLVHNCFFSACLGLGPELSSRLYSDPGGISVVDVDTRTGLGNGMARVECFNNFAHPSYGPVLGYTSCLPLNST